MSFWDSLSTLDIAPEHRVTLGEGGTPLVRSRRIGPSAGLDNLWFKVELSNPSGSYKDRFAAVAISQMMSQGKRRCLATSSGNTGSSLAAYCAAAGIECRIAIVAATPEGKLRQMLAYGARLVRVEQFGLDASITERTMNWIRDEAAAPDAALQISAYRYSPVGMRGCETIAHELAAQTKNSVEHVFCQAGGGGLTLSVARGFESLAKAGGLNRSPAVHCVQPAGNDTIAGPLRAGDTKARTVSCTSTVSGLQVPNVIDGDDVIAACRSSGGTGHSVSDEQVWTAQRRLAREEGLFCEPAAATALAGVLNAAASGELPRNALVVCLLTSSAFKDPPSLERMIAADTCPTLKFEQLPAWMAT